MSKHFLKDRYLDPFWTKGTGLLTFAVPNYKTVLRRKISFRHYFRKSVMFGLRFFFFLLSRRGLP